MLQHIRVLVFGSLVVGVLAGCTGSSAESLYPVEGKVRYKGKPLTTGAVILFPDASKGNKSLHEPRGSIDGEGHYKVTTHPRPGAPTGWYKVGVIATEPSDPKNPYAPPRPLIEEKFGRPDESNLTLEVRIDAAPGAYDLDLK